MFSGPTLGWGVLRHGARFLPSPADETKSLILTDEQAEFVLRWYAVNEEGEYIHRRAAIEMAKGWGKSPLAGFIAIEELVGPVTFDHWDRGEPIGRPWRQPWVQIAAVSEDQTDNTYSAIYEMLVANDHRAAKELGIDDGRTRLYVPGGRLEPVTASAGSREGQRITFAVEDETHLWTRRNGGVKLAGTLRRNAAKMGGRTLETTNAPQLGEKSVAELSVMDMGVLLMARRLKKEPDPSWSDEQLLEALDEVYGEAIWIDRPRILAEVRDSATNWDDALRYYFNWRTAGSGRAVDPRRWDELAHPRDVPAKTLIGLGFDGSISRDATALVACTRDGYSWPIKIWERPADAPDDWRISRTDVADVIADTFDRYKVGLMLADPPKWATEIETWAKKYGEDTVLAFDTFYARRMAPAVDRWRTAIREGTHTHSGDETLARHVKAARLKKVRIADSEDDGRSRYVLDKGDGRDWIDGGVADVLAYEAAMTMPEVVTMPVPDFFMPGESTDPTQRSNRDVWGVDFEEL
jgi:hypothetical protein